MKTIEEPNYHFELSTGRKFYAHGQILGIAPDLSVTYGYDGGLFEFGEFEDTPLTAAERSEIADYMIDLWTRFKANPEAKP